LDGSPDGKISMVCPILRHQGVMMDAVDAPPAPLRPSLDVDKFRLRTFVESLVGSEELQILDQPVDLADVAEVFEANPKAVWLREVGPEGVELVGGVDGSRERLARAFGVTPAGLLPEVLRRLRTAPKIVELSRDEAPVQQVVLTGDDADLTALPVHLQHGMDGAPYISASVDYAVDPKTGWTNVGMRRLMLRGPREAGIDLVSPSDLRVLYEASVAAGRPLPVSFTVGSHPVDHVAATLRLPVDELGLVASLRDAPLPRGTSTSAATSSRRARSASSSGTTAR
jgi:2,5-furandicarboxylate decarboxylase 1